MRRSIASIALAAVLAAAGVPLRAASASAMPCCRGGAAMACCLPGPGCAIKSCLPAESAAALLPGLPPAIVETSALASDLLLSNPLHRSDAASPRPASFPPPDEPPRG